MNDRSLSEPADANTTSHNPTIMPPVTISTMSVIGPFMLSALAITYDVGFFSGANIDYFTLFSLSEHFVFALQSIPVIASAVLMIGSWFVSNSIGDFAQDRKMKALLAKIKNSSPEEGRRIAQDAVAKIERLGKFAPQLLNALLWLMACCAVTGTLNGAYWQSLAAILFVCYFKWTAAVTEYFRRSTAAVFVIVAVTTLVFTFLIGYQKSVSIKMNSQATENVVTNDRTLPAKVIRSGERGLLFFATDTMKLQFLRWDSIKSIDTL